MQQVCMHDANDLVVAKHLTKIPRVKAVFKHGNYIAAG